MATVPSETGIPDKIEASSSQPSKPQRVLACVSCQQKKIKCDRKYPCANCIKSRAQCVPATQVTRQRRRRFPERELIERLRQYEDLLRQNDIKFEPLHKGSAGDDSDGGLPKHAAANAASPSSISPSERVYEAKNVFHAMNLEFRDPDNQSDSSDDDVRRIDIKEAASQLYGDEDHLLFGARKTAVDVSTLHPDPVQIFRLWQLYLDNVNPLLKVTHASSLQGRIIEAAGNVLNIEPTLEALMFSIYCMSILSLGRDDCVVMFGSSKADLMTRYQFGCQQALLNCSFLRTSDRECLTALVLYLMSATPDTSPESLCSLLGIAFRIAERMGIHSESSLAKCTALEAELCRRLWWSLIFFDARVGEMGESKTPNLTPTWDCRICLNVNDSDFQVEKRDSPQALGMPSEAIFTVLRSEVGDFVRQCMYHLDFVNPALKPIGREAQCGALPEGSELIGLERLVEEKYLKWCDLDNPLHYMTVWTTRATLAKARLVEHHSRYVNTLHQSDAQRDASISHALTMLKCDTKILSSLTKGFYWMAQFYFPFPAYVHVLQNLKRRPLCLEADEAWEAMGENHEARLMWSDRMEARVGYLKSRRNKNSIFKMFSRIVLLAWEAREIAFIKLGRELVVPVIVQSIIRKMSENAQNPDAGDPIDPGYTGSTGRPIGVPMGYGSDNMLYSMEAEGTYVDGGPDMLGMAPLDVDINQFDWSAMDWGLGNAPIAESGDSTQLY